MAIIKNINFPLFSIDESSIIQISDISVRLLDFSAQRERYTEDKFREKGIRLEKSLTHASEKRRMDFLRGRLCAAEALLGLTNSSPQVGIGYGGEPIWPNGVIGSISHSDEYAVAVAVDDSKMNGIGLDIESWLNFPIEQEAHALLFQEDELTLLKDDELALTLAFSAKESFFKAAYRQVRTFFDFHAVRVIKVDSENSYVLLEQCSSLHISLPAGMRHVVSFKSFGNTHWLTCVGIFPTCATISVN